MKKTLLLLLSALLLLSTAPMSLADDEPTPIATRAELALLAENPSGSFLLTDDIDMGGEPWTPIAFSGTLDGGGHTLYNLTVTAPGTETVTTYDGNRKEYDTALAGLFTVLDGATVRNLNLMGAYIAVETEQNCFIAGLAGYAKNATVENCAVEVYATLTLSGIDFDFEKNATAPRGEEIVLSKPESKIKVMVLPTNEELAIARDTAAIAL